MFDVESLKFKKYAALSLAVALSINAFGQKLSTEVVVERSIQPTERAASRLSGLSPAVVLPKAENINLSTANYGGVSEIARGYSFWPTDEAMKLLPPTDPTKGYIVLGYFPIYNLGISAGYRVTNELNVWGQFCGESYDAPHNFGDMSYNGGRIGADFRKYCNISGQSGLLTASLSYLYANNETPLRSAQSLNSGDFFARFTSEGDYDYNLGLGLGFDSYGDFTPFDAFDAVRGVSKFRMEIDGGASMPLGEGQKAGLDANLDYGNSLGVLKFTPYYAINVNNFDARVGIDLDMSVFGDNAIDFAPDVTLQWAQSSKFAAKATFTGGVMLNTMNHVREISPYLPGVEAYGRSKVPVDAELQFTFNVYAGLSAELFGGYAVAENWLMPDAEAAYSPMALTDVEGWHVGLRVNYKNKMFKAGVSAETAASDVDKAYYLWRDRAKYVFGAYAEVSPIDRLIVGLDYEFRSGRHTAQTSLGCVSNLGLNASYQITPRLAAFLQAENLLGRRYQQLPGIYSQSIHGLFGLSFKF